MVTVYGAATDIHEQRVAVEALRESEERLHTVIESIKDYALFTLDAQGRVTSWSDGARRMMQYEAEEVIGGPVAMFYTPEDAAAGKPAADMERARATGRSEEESWRVRKDGSRVWANEIVTPLHDGHGRVGGFTKILKNSRFPFSPTTSRLFGEIRDTTIENALLDCVDKIAGFAAAGVDAVADDRLGAADDRGVDLGSRK